MGDGVALHGEDEPGSDLGLMFSRAERAKHTLLQDGTAHRWEEGMHLTGVFVHLNRTNECFMLLLDQWKVGSSPGLWPLIHL